MWFWQRNRGWQEEALGLQGKTGCGKSRQITSNIANPSLFSFYSSS